MCTATVSHDHRAVPMCRTSTDCHARFVTLCVHCAPAAADICIVPTGLADTRRRCRHLPAALIVARDSLCANSMALGGRAGNDSCKWDGVAGCLM